jgi:hypothetical protein
MDRGIKDEGFVRYALEIAESEDGRWLANQSFFNHKDTDPVDPKLKSVLVTAVAVYANKFNWPETDVSDALAVSTVGDARALVDRLGAKVPPRS